MYKSNLLETTKINLRYRIVCLHLLKHILKCPKVSLKISVSRLASTVMLSLLCHAHDPGPNYTEGSYCGICLSISIIRSEGKESSWSGKVPVDNKK